MINTVLDERFRIDESLSKSEGGETFKGLDLETNQKAIVKVLRPSASAESNEQLQRRLQEFRLLKRLNHPNAVHVIQTGLTEDNAFYVAMEHVDGKTLNELVKETGPMPPERVCGILDQLAGVLDAAHDADVVHRDIKLRNIIAYTDEAGQERVKLIGFVFAKILSGDSNQAAMTQAGVAVGTPAFMSPEQAMGRKSTRHSDIYSLGVVLYYLLTERLPFSKANDLQTMLAHVKEPVPAFTQLNPAVHVAPAVEAVVRQALAKTPADRPATAGELARMFREALEHPDQMPAGVKEKETPRVLYKEVEIRDSNESLNLVLAIVAVLVFVGLALYFSGVFG